jgi:prepilin-type N-terminal cleavage/methylation domain-containing protein
MMSPRRTRGFTLIELLMSMTIMMVAVAAAFGVMVNQNAMLKKQSGLSSAISQSELAFDAIERSLRLAGTGIDPQFAFDFDFYRCALPGGASSMSESANCQTANPIRDSIAQPDELVVMYRDPSHSVWWPTPGDTRSGCATPVSAGVFAGKVWAVTGATTTNVTLLLKPGDTIYRGQVLQIACDDGATYTYATVNQNRTSQTGTSCAAATLVLYGTQANDPFNQPGFLGATCFSSGTARAFAIRRQRYFVYRDLNATPPRPYLMLDQGLDLDDSGTLTDADLLPIASDIEDLQIAYVTEQPGILSLATPPTGFTNVRANVVIDSNADGVWGNDPGRVEQLSELALVANNSAQRGFAAVNSTFPSGALNCQSYASIGFYNYPCLWGILPVENSPSNDVHAYRWVAWSGGITGAIVSIVARSPGIDSADVISSDENTLPAVLNRPASSAPFPAWYAAIAPAGHKRVTVSTSVRPPNLAAYQPHWN